MFHFVYTLFYYLLAPFLCVRWLVKSINPPLYREPINERFGFVKKQSKKTVWIHAVSMGESKGAVLLIKQLLKSKPDLKIVVTTTTPTGAKEILDALGASITHHYSPCDLPGTIKRFIKRVKPELAIIMETELWPNWLKQLEISKIPVVLANARLSENSFKSYARFSKTSHKMFSRITQILAIDEADASRFQLLRQKTQGVLVSGNIKYDMELPDFSGNEDYFPSWKEQLIWIAASTHKGEEQQVLATHKKLLKYHPDLKLVLVPRHPQRFAEVAQYIEQQGLTYSQRSLPASWDSNSQVLLGDSMGELMAAYQLADIAFVGGSLSPIGGHNAMEPALLKKPIISGDCVFNFQDLFSQLVKKEAAVLVTDERQLEAQLLKLIESKALREQMGTNAHQVVVDNQGAVEKSCEQILKYL